MYIVHHKAIVLHLNAYLLINLFLLSQNGRPVLILSAGTHLACNLKSLPRTLRPLLRSEGSERARDARGEAPGRGLRRHAAGLDAQQRRCNPTDILNNTISRPDGCAIIARYVAHARRTCSLRADAATASRYRPSDLITYYESPPSSTPYLTSLSPGLKGWTSNILNPP